MNTREGEMEDYSSKTAWTKSVRQTLCQKQVECGGVHL
jgi:hypothetical protein